MENKHLVQLGVAPKWQLFKFTHIQNSNSFLSLVGYAKPSTLSIGSGNDCAEAPGQVRKNRPPPGKSTPGTTPGTPSQQAPQGTAWHGSHKTNRGCSLPRLQGPNKALEAAKPGSQEQVTGNSVAI